MGVVDVGLRTVDQFCSPRGLDDALVQQEAINLFGTFVKARDPRFGVARRVQISEVRVPAERFAEFCRSIPRRRWILRKPSMHQTM